MDLDGGDLGGLLVAQAARLLDHLDGECQNAASRTMASGFNVEKYNFDQKIEELYENRQ